MKVSILSQVSVSKRHVHWHFIQVYICSFCFPLKIRLKFEPRREKTGLRGFRPGPTQTDLYSHRSRLGLRNLGFKKKRDCTIRVAKIKALISFAVTAKPICAFVFAWTKIRFSHVAAQIMPSLRVHNGLQRCYFFTYPCSCFPRNMYLEN